MRTGEPVMGIEVRGQKADKSNADHVWTTNWHPLTGRRRPHRRRQRRRRGHHRTQARRSRAQRQPAGAARKRDALPGARRQHQPVRLDRRSGWLDLLVQQALARLHRDDTRRDGRVGLAEGAPSRPCRARGRSASGRASKPARPGRTPSRCAAATATIAGSCRARCRSATRPAKSSAGSAPTPISPSRSKPRRRCAKVRHGSASSPTT